MDRKRYNELNEKYIKGETTTSEEKSLIENSEESASVYKPWFKFLRQNKKVAPPNLKESVWDTIQAKRIKKRRLHMLTYSAAASILLLFSLLIFNMEGKKQNYKRKEALLIEAKKMFNNAQNSTTITQPNIIYEDNMIIIYTTLE